MLIAEGFSPAVWEGEMVHFSIHLREEAFILLAEPPIHWSIKIYAQRSVKDVNVYFIKLILMEACWIANSQAMF